MFGRRGLRALCLVALYGALTACGFALRGPTELPFDSLYINVPPNAELGAQMRRQLRANAPATTIVENPNQAAARLEILSETRDRREQALTAQGRVQEYDLTLLISFQVVDDQAEILVPPTTLTTTRTLYYDDNVAQAKESEAETLYRSMRNDLMQRILLRLSAQDTREAVRRASGERMAAPAQPVR
ncbi:LPS assembly lipoprotein LptE [Verticiella sediminum]|nr:LPS assembly lipoprotein LptE [Verticiella sediminum]